MATDSHEPTSHATPTPTHLTKNPTEVGGNPEFDQTDLSPREYFCRRCCLRVTQATDGSVEYGHHPECRHAIDRINHLPDDP